MRRTGTAVLTVSFALGALVLGAPSPASAAATDFGNGCSTVSGSTNTTTVYIYNGATNPLPAGAPQTGVITKARFTLPSVPGTLPFEVKVLRATGAPNQFTVVAQSGTVNVGSGTQTYAVRVPVTAGDLLGVSGYAGLYCSTGDAGDVTGQVGADLAVGATAVFTTASGVAIPLVATVEPDADHDGYGDITQDGCPQSAAFQGPCPAVVVRSLPTTRGSSITVLVTTNNAASVTVTGLAKVDGKKIKLKSRTTSVNPGDLAQIKVKLPRALKRALAGLPSRRSIKVTFTTSATDAIGRVTTSKSSVKLPGTGH